MSATTTFSVTSGAAVRIINAGVGNTFAKVTSFGGLLYLGADNTVTPTTGVLLDSVGEKFQFTAAGEVWAISKDATASVRVLSWT